MGYDAACQLTIDGRRFDGTARLERTELIFRGETRVVIPLADVASAEARGDDLVVAFGTKRARFTIGPDAARWAERIVNPPSRSKKLGIKTGVRAAVTGLDDPAFVHELEAGGAVLLPLAAKNLDAIFFGVHTTADLERLSSLAPRLAPAGALWLVRVKGKAAAVSEAASMAAGKRAGLVDVKVVSFDDTHSAEKYVVPVARRTPAVRPPAPEPGRRAPARAPGRTASPRSSR